MGSKIRTIKFSMMTLIRIISTAACLIGTTYAAMCKIRTCTETARNKNLCQTHFEEDISCSGYRYNTKLLQYCKARGSTTTGADAGIVMDLAAQFPGITIMKMQRGQMSFYEMLGNEERYLCNVCQCPFESDGKRCIKPNAHNPGGFCKEHSREKIVCAGNSCHPDAKRRGKKVSRGDTFAASYLFDPRENRYCARCFNTLPVLMKERGKKYKAFHKQFMDKMKQLQHKLKQYRCFTCETYHQDGKERNILNFDGTLSNCYLCPKHAEEMDQCKGFSVCGSEVPRKDMRLSPMHSLMCGKCVASVQDPKTGTGNANCCTPLTISRRFTSVDRAGGGSGDSEQCSSWWYLLIVPVLAAVWFFWPKPKTSCYFLG